MKDMIYLFPGQKRFGDIRSTLKGGDINLATQVSGILSSVQNLPTFGDEQFIPKDEMLEIMDLSLPEEWQKQMIIQGFDSATQGLAQLVGFCESLETAEEIIRAKGEGNHQIKKPNSPVNTTNPPIKRRKKGHTRPQNIQKMMQTEYQKIKTTFMPYAWTQT